MEALEGWKVDHKVKPSRKSRKRYLVAFFHPETDKLELGWSWWHEKWTGIHYLNGKYVAAGDHVLLWHNLPDLPLLSRSGIQEILNVRD